MKLTGTKKIMGGLALAGTLALTGIVGFAQQGTTAQGRDGQEHAGRHGGEGKGRRGGGMRGGFHGPFGKLNLTDAQKEQMKQIATRTKGREGPNAPAKVGAKVVAAVDPSTGFFDESAVARPLRRAPRARRA